MNALMERQVDGIIAVPLEGAEGRAGDLAALAELLYHDGWISYPDWLGCTIKHGMVSAT